METGPTFINSVSTGKLFTTNYPDKDSLWKDHLEIAVRVLQEETRNSDVYHCYSQEIKQTKECKCQCPISAGAMDEYLSRGSSHCTGTQLLPQEDESKIEIL